MTTPHNRTGKAHASLFSGIGGFDLAAEWMGWNNVMQCEIDPFCQKVLKHHFPSSQLYGDIREIDGTQWQGKIDILTGGFPCQPFSAAGERRGTNDDRYLWPEMLRVIRECRPTWIVAENVRGLANWNDGMVLESVCSELEENEYEVQPFCIPSCGVEAPHRRERMWFVATHAKRERLQGCMPIKRTSFGAEEAFSKCGYTMPRTWDELERSVRGLRDGDGLSVGMVRSEIKAYGNAIVPQVAYMIFQSISLSHT